MVAIGTLTAGLAPVFASVFATTGTAGGTAGVESAAAEGSRATEKVAVHDGAPSKEVLIDRFLQALRDKDLDALRRLRLSESEYREIVMPGHVPVGQPHRNWPEDVKEYAWKSLNTKCFYLERALVAQYGGHAYEVKEAHFEEGVEQYDSYVGYKQLRLRLREGDREAELATGSIAEIDGQFKFVSYIRD